MPTLAASIILSSCNIILSADRLIKDKQQYIGQNVHKTRPGREPFEHDFGSYNATVVR